MARTTDRYGQLMAFSTGQSTSRFLARVRRA